jgi:amidophosphoribosyltransferase
MARIIGVDSLAFLSLEGLYRAVAGRGRQPAQPQYCDACFSGNYPTRLEDQGSGRAADQLSLMLEDA